MNTARANKTEHISEVLDRVLSELTELRRDNHELRAMVSDLHNRAEKNPDQLMTVKQASIYYGVTPNTIRNWENRGKIHRVTMAGITGFPKIGSGDIGGTSTAPK